MMSSQILTGSSRRRKKNVGRSSKPPILLSFTDYGTVSIGQAGQANAKHTARIYYNGGPSSSSSTSGNSSSAAERYYDLYAATISNLLLLQKGASGGSIGSVGSNQSMTIFVVLHTDLYANRHWKMAIARILYENTTSTTAAINSSKKHQQRQQQNVYVCFQSSLYMIPMVVPTMVTTKNRGNGTTFLSVYFSSTQVQCMIYSQGQNLQYTYQSCAYIHNSDDGDDRIISPSLVFENNNGTKMMMTVRELVKLQQELLTTEDTTYSPLIMAICLCLQACPMIIRKDAIQNILLAGLVVWDDLNIALAKRLYEFLSYDDESSTSPSPPHGGDDGKESKEEEEEPIPATMATTTTTWTSVPLHRTPLRPLASSIGLVEIRPIHPQLLPFLGASVWAHHHWKQGSLVPDKLPLENVADLI